MCRGDSVGRDSPATARRLPAAGLKAFRCRHYNHEARLEFVKVGAV